jgi:hypothetical protein
MSGQDSIVGYAPVRVEHGYLALDARDGAVRVTFPVMPKWVYVSQIAFALVAGLCQIAVPVFVVFMYLRHSVLKQEFSRELWVTMVEFLVAGAVWTVGGAYEWWKYRRWGRAPRVLTADQQGVMLTWFGFGRIRRRTWPADEIAAIEFRIVKTNLNPWRTLGRLEIIRRNGRKRVFRLSSKDPELPRRIAERVAASLHHSLKFIE